MIFPWRENSKESKHPRTDNLFDSGKIVFNREKRRFYNHLRHAFFWVGLTKRSKNCSLNIMYDSLVSPRKVVIKWLNQAKKKILKRPRPNSLVWARKRINHTCASYLCVWQRWLHLELPRSMCVGYSVLSKLSTENRPFTFGCHNYCRMMPKERYFTRINIPLFGLRTSRFCWVEDDKRFHSIWTNL